MRKKSNFESLQMTDVKCGENVIINVNCGCNSAYGDLMLT